MKMKVHLYGKRIHLKGCKYADLVNVDTFDFKHCIVVEKRLVLVYTGHKYKIDICDPKSKKQGLFFYLFGGKSMNYKQSVKKIQAGIEEKLRASIWRKKRKQLQMYNIIKRLLLW